MPTCSGECWKEKTRFRLQTMVATGSDPLNNAPALTDDIRTVLTDSTEWGQKVKTEQWRPDPGQPRRTYHVIEIESACETPDDCKCVYFARTRKRETANFVIEVTHGGNKYDITFQVRRAHVERHFGFCIPKIRRIAQVPSVGEDFLALEVGDILDLFKPYLMTTALASTPIEVEEEPEE